MSDTGQVGWSSTGFSTFEWLYGRKVRGPLDVLKNACEREQPEQQANVLSYILKMRYKMESPRGGAAEPQNCTSHSEEVV